MKLYYCEECSRTTSYPKFIDESIGYHGYTETMVYCPHCGGDAIHLKDFDTDPRTEGEKETDDARYEMSARDWY